MASGLPPDLARECDDGCRVAELRAHRERQRAQLVARPERADRLGDEQHVADTRGLRRECGHAIVQRLGFERLRCASQPPSGW